MSASSNGAPGSPASRENDVARGDPTAPSTSDGDASVRSGFDTESSIAEAARVSPAGEDKPVEARLPNDFNESTVLRPEVAEMGISDASGGDSRRDQPSSSISRFQNKEMKKTKKKKIKGSVDDYDSVLSEFDQFASKGANEAVGFGYEIGDMVWGKVKSHPWWPGHIYNEAHASPSVQRSKRDGHVLVAFFGDSSYGWYDPAELIPFEENFADKSRQTSSRPFVKAVGEAVDELSRRRGLGLACRCRNEFNFWPSNVEDFFVVDVGDYEPVVYSTSQINKSRADFQPNEMLSFIKEMALTPMTHQHQTIEFIKNKATSLACRRALFEEFDETYAQAFGTIPVRPPRPTAPVAVNPSRAPLSGRLVIAETLSKKKYSVKPTKTKDQVEKDKYIFKRRDEPVHVRTKKKSPGQSGPAYPLLVDGSEISGTPIKYASGSGISDGQRQSTNQASVVSDIKSLVGSKKLVEGERKKPKSLKRRAGEVSGDDANLVMKKKKKIKKEMATEQPSGELSSENVIVKEKKRKKEIKNEASMDVVKLPLADSNSGDTLEKVSGMALDIPLGVSDNQLDNQKNNGLVDPLSSSSDVKPAIDLGKEQLPMLLKDLRALAINPLHGVERSCQATIVPLFLKYRSLVYQKSLVLFPPAEIEKCEANSSKAASTPLHAPAERISDKSTMKLKRTLIRPDDPTRGGKKQGPSIRPDVIKKKRKLDDSEGGIKRKKLIDSEDNKDVKKKKKKIIDESKLLSVEKKTLQKSNEPQRGDVKEIRAKNPASTKVGKLESGKRMQQPARVAANPTMLVMKFPPGAALPSGAHLRAKFARFGPLDHSATRVFWETYTCRLVYQQKADAETALEFALGSGNLFGSRNVRSYIREVRDKAAEVEAVKSQMEDISDAGTEQRTAARIPVQSPSQLKIKSCLKKPSNEEVGNGNGRGTRVTFILGGEGGSKAEQGSSNPEGASSYTHSSDHVTTSKNLAKFTPESIVAPPLPSHHQLQKNPVNMPGAELLPKNDISQQLLNLLTRCRDVVNNLTGAFGHVPYHSL